MLCLFLITYFTCKLFKNIFTHRKQETMQNMNTEQWTVLILGYNYNTKLYHDNIKSIKITISENCAQWIKNLSTNISGILLRRKYSIIVNHSTILLAQIW